MASIKCGRGDYATDVTPFKRLYPFRSHWFRNNGMCQHYIDEGKGSPMVMVHGNPTWSFYYRRLIERFSKDHRVVVPDHIGMGRSEKPGDEDYPFTLKRRMDDLERLLDHLKLTNDVTLVVHDWGGIIGMGVACRKPSRVSRFVILNTAAFRLPRGKKLPWQIALVRNVPGLSDIVVRGFNAFAGMATKQAVMEPMPDNVRKAFIAPYNNWKNRLAILRFVKDIPLRKADPSYKDIKWIDRNLNQLKDKPALLCWGLKDFVFGKHYLKQFQKRFPRATTLKFADAGHYVLEDKPREIIKAMEEFFEENPVGGKKK